MRLQIRSTLFLFLFFLFPSLSFCALVPDQVITSDEIQQAGLIRLTDLYSLVDDWNSYTIDGYTWHSSPGGNELLNNDWLLLVDGKKIFLESLDGKNLNHLPINITTIDSVAIFSRPVVYNGFFTSNGLISITTKKPAKGITWNSNYNLGNETKDPGPYTFIEEKDTPNVDKIGPDYSNSFSLAKDSDYARLHIIEHGHFNTDPNIKERMEIANQGVYPKMQNLANSFDSFINFPKLDFNILFYRANHDDFYESHLTPQPYRIKNKLSEISLSIESKVHDSLNPFYHIDISQDIIKFPTDYNWKQRRYDITTGLKSAKKGISYHFEGNILKRDYSIFPDDKILNHYLNTWHNISIGSFNFSLGLEGNYIKSELGYKSFIQIDRSINKYLSSSISANYFNISPYETPEFWVVSSHDPSPYMTIDYYTPKFFYNDEREKRYDFNIINRLKISEKLSGNLDFNFTHFEGYDFDYFLSDDETLPIEPDITDYDYELVRVEYNSLRFSTAIKHKISKYLKHTFKYQANLQGDMKIYRYLPGLTYIITEYPHLFSQYSVKKHIPENIVRYNLVYSTTNFSAGLFLKWQSETKWDNGKTGDYTDTDAFFNVNISLSKGFWKDRARLTFMGQNLLNDEIQYHPFGAGVYDLTFWTKLDLHLNSADLLGR